MSGPSPAANAQRDLEVPVALFQQIELFKVAVQVLARVIPPVFLSTDRLV